jgi:flagella basal body P-ring formation protein FlgA
MTVAVALFAIAVLSPTATLDTPAPGSDAVVASAIVDAVRQRLGADAEVDVADVTTVGHVPAGRLEAVPDPGGRIGGRIGFSLVHTAFSDGRVQAVRVGSASATVRVRLEHVRLRRFVARGMDVAATDVEVVLDDVASTPLRRLPRLAEVLGGRALRDLPVGACVTAGAVVLQPVVRTGDEVVVSAAGPDYLVTATMVAAESGAAGAVIRVVNRESRRTVRARVVSKGVVDVLHD